MKKLEYTTPHLEVEGIKYGILVCGIADLPFKASNEMTHSFSSTHIYSSCQAREILQLSLLLYRDGKV